MDIEYSGSYEKKTYFQAVSWVLKPTKSKLIGRLALFLLAGGLFAAYLITLSKEGESSTYDSARAFRNLLMVLFLLYYLLTPYLSAYRSATRLWNDPITRRKITGRVSSQGVIMSPIKDWIAWESFVKVHQSPELVVLVTAENTFIALPRTFFSTDADWNFLRQMIERRVVEVI